MSDDVDMAEASTSAANVADELQDPSLADVDKEILPDAEVKKDVANGDDDDTNGTKENGGNDDDDAKEDEEEAKKPMPMPQPSLLRKDKCLKEFLESMDEYAPIIPDAVTDYYLAKSGFETGDRRIKRLLALATQKFVSDVASDAYQYSRIRSSSSVASAQNPQARARALAAGGQAAAAAQSSQAAGAAQGGGAGASGAAAAGSSGAAAGGPAAPAASGGGGSSANNQGKLVLTMEDLGNALADYGLNVKRPDFYR